MALRPFVGPWPHFSVSRSYTESVGLLGRGISQSQGRYLHTGQYKHRINTHTQPCLKWDWNPRPLVFKRAQTVHALHRTVTMIDLTSISSTKYLSTNTRKVFCKHDNYDCHYEFSGYHSNAMLKGNTMHNGKLCEPLTSDQSFVCVSCLLCEHL
jgi:hypothetical protein